MEIFGPEIELFRSSQKGFNCKTWVEIPTGSKNGGRFAPVLDPSGGRRKTSKYPRVNGLLRVSQSGGARGTGLCDWDLA